MTRRLSGHFPVFGLVFFVLKSLLVNYCKTVESWKFFNFDPKASESCQNFNISNIGYLNIMDTSL